MADKNLAWRLYSTVLLSDHLSQAEHKGIREDGVLSYRISPAAEPLQGYVFFVKDTWIVHSTTVSCT